MTPRQCELAGVAAHGGLLVPVRSDDRRAAREQQFADAINAIAIAYRVLPAEVPLPCCELTRAFQEEGSWLLALLDEYEREEFVEQLERDYRLRDVLIALKQLRSHLLDEAAKLGIPESEATWPAIEKATGESDRWRLAVPVHSDDRQRALWLAWRQQPPPRLDFQDWLLEDGLAKLQAAFVALGDSVTVGRTRAPITVLGDPPWQPEYFDDVLDLPLQQQRLYDIRKQRDVKRLHEHLDWLEPQLQALAVPAGVTVGEWDWPALLEHEASVQEAAASGTPMVSVATEEVAANHSARMPHEWHHRIHGLTYEQTFEVCAELYRRKHAGETWSQLAASYVVAESTLRDRYDWYVETTGAPT